ncbi:alpha-amylase family protein [Robinsoniella peoriensis]|uniref:Alpha-L-fucosidase n=1 Tax=Robinsoniella peoriensis TaxID=180332 RepID=A0A4U8Q4D3_9FIRM|nr:alpha-amylase family protein [Robinsoniella peoriensis]MDU7030288.1 alpha-L-fucosidase [Clostridiales bacterium]TLC99630.1 Alpha-L-fucosidase [Robinsoniella peoriensis]
MWIKGNYRRMFLDMHIADDKPEYLSRLDPEKLVAMLNNAGAQQIVVKCRTHTGLAHYPTKIGLMHKGLHGRDYVKEMIELCHKNGIAVKAYFSQNYDNYAYDIHPEWRMVNGLGLTSREEEKYTAESMFRKGRYGIVCPNNEEYRQFVHDCLTEITWNYEFESIFLDMPFWPEVCFCPSCRKKYKESSDKDDLPRIVDWSDPEFREYQYLREKWMAEFCALSTKAVKDVRPEVTIEHNMCVNTSPWRYGTSDLVGEECDYIGGDLYGGILEESFICKYFRNLTKELPFVYITSRCDPGLQSHTTTKTMEEFLLHAMTALVHDGALSICDGANPDGTLSEEVYAVGGPVQRAWSISKNYEKYVGGRLNTNATIWFPTHSKYDWSENGDNVCVEEDYKEPDKRFIYDKLDVCKILRTENIPFDVIPSRRLDEIPNNLLIISEVVNIRDEEMEKIEKFVREGGNIYLSGHFGHPRLPELLDIKHLGQTDHNVTYMSCTPAGQDLFQGFTKQSPMAVQDRQELMEVTGDAQVLATITLPYTMTGRREFSSIHSDPPGVKTDYPAMILKNVGKGKILYAAAPIERSRPLMSRRAFARIIRRLMGTPVFTSDAPGFVEVINWEQNNGKSYFTVLNQQEEAPYITIKDITVTVPYQIKSAHLVETNEALKVECNGSSSVISLPKLEVFLMFEVEK